MCAYLSRERLLEGVGGKGGKWRACRRATLTWTITTLSKHATISLESLPSGARYENFAIKCNLVAAILAADMRELSNRMEYCVLIDRLIAPLFNFDLETSKRTDRADAVVWEARVYGVILIAVSTYLGRG